MNKSLKQISSANLAIIKEKMSEGTYWGADFTMNKLESPPDLAPIINYIKAISAKEEFKNALKSLYWEILLAKDYGCKILNDSLKEIIDECIKKNEETFNIQPNEIIEYDVHSSLADLLNDLYLDYTYQESQIRLSSRPKIFSYRVNANESDLDDNLMTIADKDELGDLSNISQTQIKDEVKKKHSQKPWEFSHPLCHIARNNNDIGNDLDVIEIGDIIIARKGKVTGNSRVTIVGYGVVEGDYYYDKLSKRHCRKVHWIKKERYIADANNAIDKNIMYFITGSGTPEILSISQRSIYRFFAEKLHIDKCLKNLEESKDKDTEEMKDKKKI